MYFQQYHKITLTKQFNFTAKLSTEVFSSNAFIKSKY